MEAVKDNPRENWLDVEDEIYLEDYPGQGLEMTGGMSWMMSVLQTAARDFRQLMDSNTLPAGWHQR